MYNRYGILSLGLVSTLALLHAQSAVKLEQEPACQTLQPASAGGPVPKNPDVLLLRYLGRANYEVAYRGKVLLLDTYYDNSRLTFGERFGVKESDITRADAILVGHTHFDHFGDAPPIAKRTGAPIFAGPLPVKYLESQGVPEKQIHVMRGGENIKMDGYHDTDRLGHSHANRRVRRRGIPRIDHNGESADRRRESPNWRNGGKGNRTGRAWRRPKIRTIRTTTPFITDICLRADLRRRFPPALFGYCRAFSPAASALWRIRFMPAAARSIWPSSGYLQLGFSLPKAIKVTGTRVKVWDPRIFLPSHFHDGEKAELPDMPTAPLFEALRDLSPNTRSIEPLYRSPICVNTKTDESFVGYYVH